MLALSKAEATYFFNLSGVDASKRGPRAEVLASFLQQIDKLSDGEFDQFVNDETALQEAASKLGRDLVSRAQVDQDALARATSPMSAEAQYSDDEQYAAMVLDVLKNVGKNASTSFGVLEQRLSILAGGYNSRTKSFAEALSEWEQVGVMPGKQGGMRVHEQRSALAYEFSRLQACVNAIAGCADNRSLGVNRLDAKSVMTYIQDEENRHNQSADVSHERRIGFFKNGLNAEFDHDVIGRLTDLDDISMQNVRGWLSTLADSIFSRAGQGWADDSTPTAVTAALVHMDETTLKLVSQWAQKTIARLETEPLTTNVVGRMGLRFYDPRIVTDAIEKEVQKRLHKTQQLQQTINSTLKKGPAVLQQILAGSQRRTDGDDERADVGRNIRDFVKRIYSALVDQVRVFATATSENVGGWPNLVSNINEVFARRFDDTQRSQLLDEVTTSQYGALAFVAGQQSMEQLPSRQVETRLNAFVDATLGDLLPENEFGLNASKQARFFDKDLDWAGAWGQFTVEFAPSLQKAETYEHALHQAERMYDKLRRNRQSVPLERVARLIAGLQALDMLDHAPNSRLQDLATHVRDARVELVRSLRVRLMFAHRHTPGYLPLPVGPVTDRGLIRAGEYIKKTIDDRTEHRRLAGVDVPGKFSHEFAELVTSPANGLLLEGVNMRGLLAPEDVDETDYPVELALRLAHQGIAILAGFYTPDEVLTIAELLTQTSSNPAQELFVIENLNSMPVYSDAAAIRSDSQKLARLYRDTAGQLHLDKIDHHNNVTGIVGGAKIHEMDPSSSWYRTTSSFTINTNGSYKLVDVDCDGVLLEKK